MKPLFKCKFLEPKLDTFLRGGARQSFKILHCSGKSKIDNIIIYKKHMLQLKDTQKGKFWNSLKGFSTLTMKKDHIDMYNHKFGEIIVFKMILELGRSS